MRPPAHSTAGVAAALGLLIVAAALGCSSSPSPPTADAASACPLGPSACPASMPTYEVDVAPILQSKCVPCHSTVTGGKDESTYDLAAGQESSILFQVNDCLMPPSGSPQLSVDDRNALLGWIECGAPDQ